MNVAFKRDPVWLSSLSSCPILLLIGGDGQKVAVPAPLILAHSPLVRSILVDLLPPAFEPCIFSLADVTSKVLHIVADILDAGEVVGECEDEIEMVKQVFEMLGVEVSLVSYHSDSIQLDQVLDRDIKVENASEITNYCLNDENIYKGVVKAESKEEKIEDTGIEDIQDDGVDFDVGSDKDKITERFSNPYFTMDGFSSTESEAEKDPLTPDQTLEKNKKFRPVPVQGKFTCKLCSQTFKCKKSVKRHIDSIHEHIRIPCHLCPSKFSSKRNLVIHISSVHRQIKFSCEICQHEFSWKRSLERHIKSVHEEFRIPCQLCPSKFTTKRGLLRHMAKLH